MKWSEYDMKWNRIITKTQKIEWLQEYKKKTKIRMHCMELNKNVCVNNKEMDKHYI